MKKQLFTLVILFLLLTGKLTAQFTNTIQTITPNGVFDIVYDRFGNQYPLVNLSLSAARPLSNSPYSVSSVITNSCRAGYFDLYFAPGSYFDLNSGAANILCEIYKNISGFISSPLSLSTNTVNRINIYCDNIPASAPAGALAAAAAFYAFPFNPPNPNGGALDSQIERALKSGQNAYSGLLVNAIAGANNFYSGLVYINPAVSWNLSISTGTIASTDYDAYSVLLHEVTHTLGFASLMGSNGISVFGSSNNYFSSYDRFLKDAAGNYLLAGPSGACPSSSLTFNSTLSALGSATTGCISDITTCSTAVHYVSTRTNVAVYTPNCFEPASSLSHFEDLCTVPASFTAPATCTTNPGPYNNLYYAMSNANSSGSCYVKRHLKPEERDVLCDIGYSVNPTFTSSAVSASVN